MKRFRSICFGMEMTMHTFLKRIVFTKDKQLNRTKRVFQISQTTAKLDTNHTYPISNKRHIVCQKLARIMPQYFATIF